MSEEVLEEILDWSQERPAWQRDALRRLFATPELTRSEISELTLLCKAAHGLSGPQSPQPLLREHLAVGARRTDAVILVSLTHHRGVNALAPEQTVTFGAHLTVVYGPNAAGKSGYTRILKRACRSRFSEDILGDLLSGEAPVAARATIRVRDHVDGRDIPWTLGEPPSGALASVSVFDAHCAPVYVRDKTDVAFRPFGLDVFDRLAAICGEVRQILQSEEQRLGSSPNPLPNLPEGTRARALIDGLTSLTNPDDVRALATLSHDEVQRLTELDAQQRDLRAADPRKLARELTLKADRIERVVSHVASLMEALGEPSLQVLRESFAFLRAARSALEALRRAALLPDLLAGTGGDEWRRMWDAATAFSTVHSAPHFRNLMKTLAVPSASRRSGQGQRSASSIWPSTRPPRRKVSSRRPKQRSMRHSR